MEETGDFANAWHALILLGDSPHLQIDHFSTSTLVLLESLREAGGLVAAWPGSPPESLQRFAALGANPTLPTPRDIVAGLSAVERDLRAGFQPELAELVMRLFSLRLGLNAQIDGRGSSIAVTAHLPRTVGDRLGQVAIQVSDPAAEARFRPVSRTLRPTTQQDSNIVLNLRIPRGSTPPTELLADIEWTILGVEHREQRRISVTPAQ